MFSLFLVLQAIPIPPAPVLQLGMGTERCATVMQGSYASGRASWILGFWTGLNAASGRSVGKSGNAQGIVATVEHQCAALPTKPLALVTLAVYQAMARDDR